LLVSGAFTGADALMERASAEQYLRAGV